MAREYETKVLDINVDEICQKLEELGAKREEKSFRLWMHNIAQREENKEEFVRLRDEGDKITIAYKSKSGGGIDNTEEIEFEVSDFEEAKKFLEKFDFEDLFYQEKKRWDYKINDIEFSIDFWPKIPAYLEVEAESEEMVVEGLKKLGLEGRDEGNITVNDVYKKYDLDIHSFKQLKFD